MKKLSLFLALLMCFSSCLTPVANAYELSAPASVEEHVVEVPVVDVDGNLIGTVSMSSARVNELAVGAYITFKGMQVLIYNGYMWVCTHPEETVKTLQFLIDAFDVLQSIFGMIKHASHNGTEYVSFEKVSGESCYRVSTTQWACAYSS